MRRIKALLHEWHMKRKIKAILRYNRAHPEECFNLEDYVQKAQD